MSRKELQFLVIHATATPEGRQVSADDIRNWHLSPKPKGNGWKQVGYTDMVHLNGLIEQLVANNDDGYVDSWEITNGVAGHNSTARHIVYVGGADAKGKAKDTRTVQQKEALWRFVSEFLKRNTSVKVAGHYQFDSRKQCPSFDVPAWLRSHGVKPAHIYEQKPTKK
ncbi:MAG: lysozyme [Cyclobacteriaceae bacterium]|nr:lysozyme [Cyclobacteriaceae bacterium]